MEQPSSCRRVGNRQRYTAQRTLVGIDGLLFSFIVHLTVLGCLWQIELLNVLSEARREVADEKIGLLNGLLWVHHVVFHFRTNDRVRQAGRSRVGASWGATIGLSVMPSEKVVKHMAWVSQKVGW